jgi:benzoate-CoA ligase
MIDIPRQYNAAYDLIQRNLQAGRGDKVAFIDDQGEYSYADLDRRSSRVANALKTLGVAREQRILLCIHDTIDFPAVFLGAIKAGIVPIAVNTLLTAKDYAYMLQDSRAKAVVVSAPLLATFESLLDTVETLEHIIVAGAPSDQADSLAAITANESDSCDIADTVADEPCFWLYSSGSTGAPKGTVHIHSSMILTAELYARPTLGIDENDVVFSAAKLFFAYGLGNGLSFPMSVGATTVLMAERPTPASVSERLRKYQPTIFYGVPTLYAAMLSSDELPRADEVNLRLCASAGEALPAELNKRWKSQFDVEIYDGIGSTEMLHIFLSNSPKELRYGTTGKPVPGYQVRLVDDDGNPITEPNETGELQINGPTAATGYWGNRLKTRHTFLGEWTRSGDKYSMDEDGFYIYAGRSDDMLKVSGIYVSPIEVESTLIVHEAVLEAAVIGKEDKDKLTKPAAFIILKPGYEGGEKMAATLKEHVKSSLAPYKYPRWFHFVDELPKTATGKIQRFKLREQEKVSDFQ